MKGYNAYCIFLITYINIQCKIYHWCQTKVIDVFCIVSFVLGREKIPLLSDKPIKSLGRQYTVELSDKQMGRVAMKQLSESLAKIDQIQLPGKYKV